MVHVLHIQLTGVFPDFVVRIMRWIIFGDIYQIFVFWKYIYGILPNIFCYIPVYRVYLKFSDAWNELFVVNWFISKLFWGNKKWKKASSPHYLKILMKLSKHGISYSLQRDSRLISKITFYANLRVSPIDTELWYFFKRMLFVIQVSNTLDWMRSVGWLCWINL